MLRAHKIRLNPTPEQIVYFRKAAGTARFAYNWGLAEIKRALDAGEQPQSALDLKARFNAIKRERFPWVYEVTKCAVEGAFRNLSAALTNFFASKRGQRRGKRLQRQVSRRVKGSNNRRKAQRKLAHAHYRVACLRADAQHKATTHIARKASLIGLEDLNVAGMLKNRKLARGLSDAALGEFARQLRYKAEWQGGEVQMIGRFYPSSKLHHGCGGYKEDLQLSDRVWRCPACGEQVERDLNAALNIRDEALRMRASPVVATSGCQLPVDVM